MCFPPNHVSSSLMEETIFVFIFLEPFTMNAEYKLGDNLQWSCRMSGHIGLVSKGRWTRMWNGGEERVYGELEGQQVMDWRLNSNSKTSWCSWLVLGWPKSLLVHNILGDNPNKHLSQPNRKENNWSNFPFKWEKLRMKQEAIHLMAQWPPWLTVHHPLDEEPALSIYLSL